MRFRLAPISVTLEDLERLKRHPCRNKQNLWAHPKNFNKDRPILWLSASKCRHMIVVFNNITYTRIFAGGGGGVKYNTCYCIPMSKLHVSVWNNSMRFAYLRGWCALRRIARVCPRLCWLLLTVYTCLTRAVTHVCSHSYLISVL